MSWHADEMAGIFAEPLPLRTTPKPCRPEWKMGTGTCRDCGGDLRPVAFLDERWRLSLDCCDEPQVDVPWPFDADETAAALDFRALGFEVVVR